MKAEEAKTKYIASCSFGKDSIATILLALENNEPLDGAVFSEVMFGHSRGISGEIPEHIDWIYSVAIPRLEQMGCKVDVVRGKKDYIHFFSQVRRKGKYKGKIYGFPLGGMCIINRECKIEPIRRYYQQFRGCDIIQYVGIAKDEPIRLARMKCNQVSLLDKYGYTEEMARELCKKHELLSPVYDKVTRVGCWFCPNARWTSLQIFRKVHPELWRELGELSQTPGLLSHGFKYGKTVQQVNDRLDQMDAQLTLF